MQFCFFFTFLPYTYKKYYNLGKHRNDNLQTEITFFYANFYAKFVCFFKWQCLLS